MADTTSWSAIAADDKTVLMRAGNRLLEMVAISAIDGSELDRQSTLVELQVCTGAALFLARADHLAQAAARP